MSSGTTDRPLRRLIVPANWRGMAYFQYGWAPQPEADGLWAIGRLARIRLPLGAEPRAVRLSLELATREGTAAVRVLVDGACVGAARVGPEPAPVTVGPFEATERTRVDVLCDALDPAPKSKIAQWFGIRSFAVEAQAGSPPLGGPAKTIINFVETCAWHSAIFEDIFDYYAQYLSPRFELVVSVDPIEGASLYHYHRVPQLRPEDIRRPAVCTIHHDVLDWGVPQLHIDCFLPVLKQMDHVFVLSEAARRLLCSTCGLAGVTRIPHGYNEMLLRARYPGKVGGKVVLGVFSKRYPRKCKGEPCLEEMYRRLSPERFDWVFVGAGRDADALMCRELGFRPRWYQRVPYERFVSLYESISALVMYSYFDGGPASIPEAAAAGCPVVCHPRGMAADLVAPEVNGLYLTHRADRDEATFNRLHDEEGLLQRLSAGMARQRESCLTWRQVVRSYEEAIENHFGL